MATPFVLDAALRIQKIEGLAALKKELAGLSTTVSVKQAGGTGGGPAAAKDLDLLTASITAAHKSFQKITLASESLVAAFGKLTASAATASATQISTAPVQAAITKSAAIAQQAITSAGAQVSAAMTSVAQKIGSAQPELPFVNPMPGSTLGGHQFQLPFQGVIPKPPTSPPTPATAVQPPPQFPFATDAPVQIPGPIAPTPNPFASQQLAQFKAQIQSELSTAALSSVGGGGGVQPGKGFVSFAPAASQIGNLTQASQKATTALQSAGKAAVTAGQTTTKAMAQAATATEKYADQIFLATKRNTAFLLGSAAIFSALSAFRAGARSVVELDKEFVRLNQTIRPTASQLAEIRETIISLGAETGTQTEELARSAVTLGQAGFEGERLTEILTALSKVPLTASLDGVENTTQGIIATLGQFGRGGLAVEDILDKVSNVSKAYAVTAADLFDAIQRGGGSFAALGGTLDEFLAMVTTVKQVTQESAASIGTAFKTITPRLFRESTLQFLEAQGIQIRDASGGLLSAFEILRQASELFQTLDPERRGEFAERLGGLRQIGKVIALLENFDTAATALNISLTSTGTFAQDAQTGLESLSAQFGQLRGEAIRLVQELAPDVFVPFLQFLTSAGHAAVNLTSALSPLLKIVLSVGAAFAGLKGIQLAGFLGSKLTGGSLGTALVGGSGILNAVGLSALTTQGPASLAGRALPPANITQSGQFLFPFAQRGLGSRVTQAARETATNPLAQLGGVIAISALADAARDASGSLGDLTAETVATVTKFVAIGALLSQQSVGRFISTTGGLVGGGGPSGLGPAGAAALSTAAAVGGVLVAGVLASKGAIERSIAEKMDEVGRAIQSIEVPDPTTSTEVQSATAQLTTQITRTIQGMVEAVSGTRGFDKQFGDRISALMSFRLDEAFGLPRAHLQDNEIEAAIKDLLKQNTQLVHSLIEAAFREDQGDVRGALARGFEGFFEAQQFAQPQALAERISDLVIEVGGGLNGIAHIAKKVQADLAASGLAEEAQRAAQQLANIIVPPAVFGQLQSFGEAVKRVSQTIDASITTFDSQLATLGGVQSAQLQSSISPEAGMRLLATGALTGLPAASPEFQANVEFVQDVIDTARRFAIRLSEGSAAIDVDQAVLDFFDTEGVTQPVRAQLQELFRNIAESVREGVTLSGSGLNPDQIEQLIKQDLNKLLPTAQAISQITSEQLASSLRLINRQAQFQSDILRQRVQTAGIRPETQFDLTQNLLRRAGVGLGAGSATGILNDRGLLDRTSAATRQLDAQMSEVVLEINRALSTGELEGGRTLPQLMQQFSALNNRSLVLQSAMESLTQSVSMLDRANQESIDNQKSALQVIARASAQQAQIREIERITPDLTAEERESLRLADLRNRDLLEAAETSRADPENRLKREQLDRAIIEFKQRELDDLIRANNARRLIPGVEEVLARRDPGTLGQIGREAQLRSEIESDRLDLATKELTRGIESFRQALTEQGIARQESLARQLGIIGDDPLRTQIFQEAVNKFGQIVHASQLGPVINPSEATRRTITPSGDVTFHPGAITEPEPGEVRIDLNAALQDTARAIREGVGVKVESIQNVNVRVEGLAQEIETQIRPVLEDAVKTVASSIIRRTLNDLAGTSDPEGARAFNMAARNLA